MNLVFSWINHRLREPSTYFGIVSALLGAIGVAHDDGFVQSIAGALAVLVGAALTIYRERNSPDAPVPAPAPADVDNEADVARRVEVQRQRGKLPDDAPFDDPRERFRHRGDL